MSDAAARASNSCSSLTYTTTCGQSQSTFCNEASLCLCDTTLFKETTYKFSEGEERREKQGEFQAFTTYNPSYQAKCNSEHLQHYQDEQQDL